ncbi:MAG: hypothetical protein WAQ98_17775 [Blastocatellia bacterium]
MKKTILILSLVMALFSTACDHACVIQTSLAPGTGNIIVNGPGYQNNGVYTANGHGQITVQVPSGMSCEDLVVGVGAVS